MTTKEAKNNPGEPSEESDSPTVTQGGAVPGASESSNNQNAYPRPDATLPGTMPEAIRDGMGDPTGDRNREQLLAVAQDLNIEGAATMNRAQLADALKEQMSVVELATSLHD